MIANFISDERTKQTKEIKRKQKENSDIAIADEENGVSKQNIKLQRKLLTKILIFVHFAL